MVGVGIAVASGPVRVTPPSGSAAPDMGGSDPAVQDGAGGPASTGYVSPQDRPTAVFLGDSITLGMTLPEDRVVGPHSWFYGLLDDTAGVVRWGGSVAENGRTTWWMADQVWTALELSPDILVVHGGTNDVSGEITPPVVVNNLERIRQAAVMVGVPLAVCTLPPRSDPVADARVLAVNEAVRAWAADSGVILLDTAAPLRDPVTGGWLPGYTTDGMHPTPEGARVMSEQAAKILREIPLGV